MSFIKLTCPHCNNSREIYKSTGIPDCPICGTYVTGTKPYGNGSDSFCHTATTTQGCKQCGKYAGQVLTKPLTHYINN
jgi:ribosomal protein S27E